MKKRSIKTAIVTMIAVVAMSATVFAGSYSHGNAFSVAKNSDWFSSAVDFKGKASHTMTVNFQKVYSKGNTTIGIYRKILNVYWSKYNKDISITTGDSGVQYKLSLGTVPDIDGYYSFGTDANASYRISSFSDKW